MLKACHNTPVNIDGWTVRDLNGGMFSAMKDEITVLFLAEGRAGCLHFILRSYFDFSTNRNYTAWKFIKKYEYEIKMIAETLARNNYLWDYEWQKPFYETWYALNPRDVHQFI